MHVVHLVLHQASGSYRMHKMYKIQTCVLLVWKEVNYDELLRMADFRNNSAKLEITGIFPFKVKYGMLSIQSYKPLNKPLYIDFVSQLLKNVWKRI